MQVDLATPEAVDGYLATQMERRVPALDANDLWYQVNASWDYDPSARLERMTAPTVWINSADDFINPPELGLTGTVRCPAWPMSPTGWCPMPRTARGMAPTPGPGSGRMIWSPCWRGPSASASDLADELRAKDQSLDRGMAAVDFLIVAGQPDRFNDRPAFQGLTRALDGEILDEGDTVAIGQRIADRIDDADSGAGGLLARFSGAEPLAGGLVVDIVSFAAGGHAPSSRAACGAK